MNQDLQLDKESLENQLLQQSNTISTLRNNAEGMGIGGVEVGELSKWKSKVDELKECLDLKDKEVIVQFFVMFIESEHYTKISKKFPV